MFSHTEFFAVRFLVVILMKTRTTVNCKNRSRHSTVEETSGFFTTTRNRIGLIKQEKVPQVFVW